MSDGATVTVDTKALEKKFKNLLDLTKNFKPYFLRILGHGPESDPWTIRGGIHYSFANSVSPAGKSFKPLSDIYAAWKAKHFSGDLPILMRSGHLYESLVYENGDTVLQMSNKKLVYGTKVPYANANFRGIQSRNLPDRQVMGWRKNQVNVLKLELRKYIMDVFNGKKS